MNLAVGVPDCRVVEYADDIVEDLVDWDVGVIPGVHHTRGNILQDCRGN